MKQTVKQTMKEKSLGNGKVAEKNRKKIKWHGFFLDVNDLNSSGVKSNRLMRFLDENDVRPENLKVIPCDDRTFLILHYGRIGVYPKISAKEMSAKFWNALGNP